MSKTSGSKASEEVLGLGRVIETKLRGSAGEPKATGLAAALQSSLQDEQTGSPDAVHFVARWIFEHQDGEEAHDRLSNRAAFLWLTLRASSALGELIRRFALRAYLGTAGTLQPFVEREDFFELVRWRLWTIPTTEFGAEGVLRPTGLAGFLATVCRHLAIDQIRRLATRRFEPLGADRVISIETPGADPEAELATYEEIDRAIRIAGEGHPEWLARGVAAVLSETRDREDVFAEINLQRESAGDDPWTRGAFNTFLYRFRRRLREALSGGD